MARHIHVHMGSRGGSKKVGLKVRDKAAPGFLRSHSMWSQSDYEYLSGKGYSDQEIKKLWDRDSGLGKSPVQHKKAPNVVGMLNKGRDVDPQALIKRYGILEDKVNAQTSSAPLREKAAVSNEMKQIAQQLKGLGYKNLVSVGSARWTKSAKDTAKEDIEKLKKEISSEKEHLSKLERLRPGDTSLHYPVKVKIRQLEKRLQEAGTKDTVPTEAEVKRVIAANRKLTANSSWSEINNAGNALRSVYELAKRERDFPKSWLNLLNSEVEKNTDISNAKKRG